MDYLNLKIENIKNIKYAEINIPIIKGIYCFAGQNGCGKSTIISCLGRLIVDYSLNSFKYSDNPNQKITYEYKNSINEITKTNDGLYNLHTKKGNELKFKGIYEGSIFYGTRFHDSQKIDGFLDKREIKGISDASNFVKENLSFILHGEKGFYSDLKKINNLSTAKNLRLKSVPYFYRYNDKLISQYKMSSGECLLLSLLDFLNNTINKQIENNEDEIKFIIIDEIEVALHPSAIARLYDYLERIAVERNFVIILSSHSPELIHKIKPSNLFMLELNADNTLTVTNPCYPAYAVRSVYKNDGYDYVILVEDLLAKLLLQSILRKTDLFNSCLINILPVGGWENVLKLNDSMSKENTLGIGTKILCILDGDVKDIVSEKYNNILKLFLPIPSIEKYLLVILSNPDKSKIKKEIQDNYFQAESLDELHESVQNKNDEKGKCFYKILIKNLESRNISEDLFISGITEIIFKNEDFSVFIKSLEKLLK